MVVKLVTVAVVLIIFPSTSYLFASPLFVFFSSGVIIVFDTISSIPAEYVVMLWVTMILLVAIGFIPLAIKIERRAIFRNQQKRDL